MGSKRSSGLGGLGALGALGALRDKLPAGPQPRYWLVATKAGGEPHGWIVVTRYRQKIGSLAERCDFALPGILVALSVIEGDDAQVRLSIVSFNITAAGGDGGRVEEPSIGPSVRVDGAPVTRVGAEIAITPAMTIAIGSYRVRLAEQPPSWPATPQPQSPPAAAAKPGADMIVRKRAREADQDLVIEGWLEISDGGTLACTGSVRCRGAIIEDGGTLRCRELVTNYLHVDNSGRGGHIEAESVRARVVHLVQLALDALIARGALHADYRQHFGGELNPSWDNAIGTLPLRPDLYVAAADSDDPAELLEDRIRAASTAGENIFVGCAPLV